MQSKVLRCKAGDLAIVVASSLGNLGRVTRVIRLLTEPELIECSDGVKRIVGGGKKANTWITETPMIRLDSEGSKIEACCFPDDGMIPLRDSKEEDEMLKIAGKPKEVEA